MSKARITNVANMSLRAIHENIILARISEFTEDRKGIPPCDKRGCGAY